MKKSTAIGLSDWPHALNLLTRWSSEVGGLEDDDVAELSASPQLRLKVIGLIDDHRMLGMVNDSMLSTGFIPKFTEEQLQKLVGFLHSLIYAEAAQSKASRYGLLGAVIVDPDTDHIQGTTWQNIQFRLESTPEMLVHPDIWVGISRLHAVCFLHNKRVYSYMTQAELASRHSMSKTRVWRLAVEALDCLIFNLCLFIEQTRPPTA